MKAPIRQAGESTRQVRTRIFRRGFWIVLGIVLVLASVGVWLAYFLSGFSSGPPHSPLWALLIVAFGSWVLLTLGLVPTGLAALAKAAVHRYDEKFYLREDLRALPPEEQAAALYPLADVECGDTRKIVRALVRDLGLQSPELTPAEPPRGGQREVAAAEAEE